MTIVYYDSDLPNEDNYALLRALRSKSDDEILFVPKNFDVMLNASKEQLVAAKKAIEAALIQKENI